MDATIVTIGKKECDCFSADDAHTNLRLLFSFMYTLAANVTGVTVFTVDGPGKLNVLQRLDVANPAAAANITLSKRCPFYCFKSPF